MNKLLLFWMSLFVVAALATACGGSSSQTSEAGTTTAGTAEATITIANMSFGDPITVAPGTQITVNNTDSVEHSVTSKIAGTFEVHVDGGAEKTFAAPSQPGEYAFYCVYHPSMTGTLIVK